VQRAKPVKQIGHNASSETHAPVDLLCRHPLHTVGEKLPVTLSRTGWQNGTV
jgi:hypothetical protein